MRPPAGDAQVAGLRAQLEALQRSFTRYLEGVERTAPLAARDAFVTLLRKVELEGRGNAAARFQLQNLRASWAALAPRYERALAQMEAGTFVPQHRRAAAASPAAPAPTRTPTGGDETAPRTGAHEPEAPDAAAQPTSTPPAPAADPLARLHAAWAAAAAQSGAAVPIPSREALAAVVAHKVAEARARSGQRQVEVRVVVEGGVPVLQVTPAKS